METTCSAAPDAGRVHDLPENARADLGKTPRTTRSLSHGVLEMATKAYYFRNEEHTVCAYLSAN